MKQYIVMSFLLSLLILLPGCGGGCWDRCERPCRTECKPKCCKEKCPKKCCRKICVYECGKPKIISVKEGDPRYFSGMMPEERMQHEMGAMPYEEEEMVQ